MPDGWPRPNPSWLEADLEAISPVLEHLAALGVRNEAQQAEYERLRDHCEWLRRELAEAHGETPEPPRDPNYGLDELIDGIFGDAETMTLEEFSVGFEAAAAKPMAAFRTHMQTLVRSPKIRLAAAPQLHARRCGTSRRRVRRNRRRTVRATRGSPARKPADPPHEHVSRRVGVAW